jgi:hypothetical protein
MKQCYLKSIAIVAITALLVNSPKKSAAQCLCSGGVQPDSLAYTFQLLPTKAPSAAITFPKFDPSLGTLNCVKFWDTLNCVSTTGVRNQAPNDVTYEFQLTVSNQITGPGINFTKVANKIYGPDDLTEFGTPGDTITYGPTNLLSNATDIKTTTNVVGYLGIGNVNFNYSINGGLISLQGGLNYINAIETEYSGKFKLAYYYCPNAVLASNIQNFTAAKKDGSIELSWLATNAQAIKGFIIEVSTDGKAFTAYTQLAADRQESAFYNYSYTPSISSKYAYFRVKQTDDMGKSAYSAIRTVSLDPKATTTLSTYPNPATNGVTINFDRLINGTYQMELVNMTGQVIYSNQVKAVNANTLPMVWGKKPNSGLYLVKITNKTTSEQQVIRLSIQ